MMRWLLVLPLVFFALFSPGTMLETPPQGGVRIVLCTGEGMVEAVMTPDGRIRDRTMTAACPAIGRCMGNQCWPLPGPWSMPRCFWN